MVVLKQHNNQEVFWALIRAGLWEEDISLLDYCPIDFDALYQLAEEQSVTAEYIPESENDYSVKCRIVENNKIIFELKTFAGSNEHAKKIADNWKKNANTIYPEILNLLNEGIKNNPI